MNVFFLDTCR